MSSKPEMYVSIDIETDGQCPGLNSMLSLGAVAYFDGQEISEFEVNLYPLDDAIQNPDTMDWWRTQPEAWEYVNKSQKDPVLVMTEFAHWLEFINYPKEDGSKPYALIAAAWPAAFDFGFVNWYMHQYYGTNPLGFSCLDIRSYANGLFANPGYYNTRATVSEGDLYKFFQMPEKQEHAHFAVHDARRQGDLLMKLIRYAAELGRKDLQ